MKKNFTHYKKNNRRDGSFWNKEYKRGGHLAISTNPSEDLEKFTRFLEREFGRTYLNPTVSVFDLGTGNGRNLQYLARTYGLRGVGYDISSEAISQAKKLSEGLPLTYIVRSISGDLDLEDESQTIVLDMMSSHFLNEAERETLRQEIRRVLKHDGWLFLKTFLRDEDEHAERLLKENPTGEAGTYFHPRIGQAEHVSTENELIDLLSPHFYIHKIYKSHRHKGRRGGAGKRRSIVIYAQKNA